MTDEYCIGLYMLKNDDTIEEFGSGLYSTHEDSVLGIIGELMDYLETLVNKGIVLDDMHLEAMVEHMQGVKDFSLRHKQK